MKSNNVKLWLAGIAVAVLLVGGAYMIGSSVARAQMGIQLTTVQTDPMVRIAAALERIATAMEKLSGSPGMMGDMSKMMEQMQERMQQCQTMMEQMQEMMKGMMGGGPMAGRAAQPAATPAEAELTRTSQAEGITVAVTFMNPLLKPEESAGRLIFKVALDTHSVDLSQFDLTKLATLRTSEGKVVNTGFSWEPESESSHHRKGSLTVPDSVDGQLLWTPETQWLELELREIGVPSRVFRWELRK